MKNRTKIILSLILGLGTSAFLYIMSQRINHSKHNSKSKQQNNHSNHQNMKHLLHSKEMQQKLNSLQALNSFVDSSESSASMRADETKQASASSLASVSYDASLDASYASSASLQQSLIDSENSDMIKNVSQANAKANNKFTTQVAKDINNHQINNPFISVNTNNLSDFGNLYRSEASSLMDYLVNHMPAGQFKDMDSELNNTTSTSLYNRILDKAYSANSSADNSNNIFKNVSYPLTQLGSVYTNKIDSADSYVLNNLSSSDLEQFKSLSKSKSSNIPAYDSVVNSYYVSLENRRVYSLIKHSMSLPSSVGDNYDENYFYNKGINIAKSSMSNHGANGLTNVINRAQAFTNPLNQIESSSDNHAFIRSLGQLASMVDNKRTSSNNRKQLISKASSFGSNFSSKISSVSASTRALLKSYYKSEIRILNSMKSKNQKDDN